ncbi:MFS transporter [Priestia megaterium]|uniref:MFS transporter n=1 Tax=Priestia megaterium TaxID=1404 RepID=UPI002E1B24DE|nr:MFS transporter [Priestia megaterium]MED4241109.1 MFS transporter [Priestia megaterium]MED4268367.1 MFS transporter [Priestia megaterium]MED4279272.1 MFS transporter [Priestia megaterium]MED4314662.1 MFS transporter [Priestia megaterium]
MSDVQHSISQLQKMKGKSLTYIRGQNFFFWASYCIVLSYLPLYFHERGLNTKEIGFILAVGPFVSIFGQPFWGIIADRLNSIKRTILLLALCSTGLCIGVYMVNDFYPTFFLMALLMFFYLSIMPLNDSMNVKISVHHNVSYSFIRAWGSIGFGSASIGLGYLLIIIHLSQLIYVYIVFMALTFFFVYNSDEPTQKRKKFEGKEILHLLKNGKFLLFLIFVFIISIPHQLNLNLLTIYLSTLGASKQIIGLAWMTATIMEGLVFLMFGKILDRYKPLPLLVAASFLFALRWFLYFSISSPEVIAILQIFQAFTFTLFLSASVRYMTEIIPPKLRATGQGVFSAVFLGIAGVIGNMVGGWAMYSYGGAIVYKWAAVLSLIGGIYAFLYMSYVGKKAY